jgi:YegS/Rv2252/BmrU family lipid kinase
MCTGVAGTRPASGTVRTKSELTEAIRERGTAVLLINIRSRRGRRHFAAARDLLEAAGFTLRGAYAIDDPSTLGAALEKSLDPEPDLLVLGGGDGTMSSAVKHLAGRDVALGVLPLGTTNNFARSLGVPLRLPGAVGVLRHGKVADVDLGLAGEDVFANLASLGVSVEVASHARPLVKRVLGRLAYPLTALTALPGHRPFRATIELDGEQLELTTHQLNIANGRFHGGLQIARDISIDDRQLVIYRLGTGGRLRLMKAMLLQAITGGRRDLAGGPYLTAREFRLETDPPLQVDIDGEVRGRTPVTFRVAPNALRVMVPDGFADS